VLAPVPAIDRFEDGSDSPPAAIVTAAPSAAIAVPVDPVYYAAKELDVYPMPLSALTPPQAPEPGRVQLLTMIDETGAVTAAEVFDAEPTGRFDSDAVAIVSAVRFSPARKDGLAVRSRVLIELVFEP
jgi:protein TonB